MDLMKHVDAELVKSLQVMQSEKDPGFEKYLFNAPQYQFQRKVYDELNGMLYLVHDRASLEKLEVRLNDVLSEYENKFGREYVTLGERVDRCMHTDKVNPDIVVERAPADYDPIKEEERIQKEKDEIVRPESSISNKNDTEDKEGNTEKNSEKSIEENNKGTQNNENVQGDGLVSNDMDIDLDLGKFGDSNELYQFGNHDEQSNDNDNNSNFGHEGQFGIPTSLGNNTNEATSTSATTATTAPVPVLASGTQTEQDELQEKKLSRQPTEGSHESQESREASKIQDAQKSSKAQNEQSVISPPTQSEPGSILSTGLAQEAIQTNANILSADEEETAQSGEDGAATTEPTEAKETKEATEATEAKEAKEATEITEATEPTEATEAKEDIIVPDSNEEVHTEEANANDMAIDTDLNDLFNDGADMDHLAIVNDDMNELYNFGDASGNDDLMGDEFDQDFLSQINHGM
ncbi:hypothetical protein LELG_01270 [Lodderomyces elongisporus NRRL YB-4239]|uniref:Uncharacterized protein n=1 Tax=Lodderomyces elongisporus (strain ATCC 11503 / CBS 2605 / JCM 1781 / NBRC 1676 / NRRL YB-4239) TaxID=379508 RepID=A5DV84_LODEL|nr:hypothetical protein LELG_01270 [Lodderomyces elongisporus NRRL YB-4239]